MTNCTAWAREEWQRSTGIAYYDLHGATTDPIGYQTALVATYADAARNHPDPAVRRKFARLRDDAHRKAAALRKTRPRR